MTNPYATHLAKRDPIAVLSDTPERLRAAVSGRSRPQLEQPIAPGKWNRKQILCHLADCEIAFGFRLRQAMAEDKHVIQPFDQDLWAKEYPALDAQDALAAFCANRAWNLALIRTLSEDELRKHLIHPERGEMDIHGLIETFAGHDLNHLKQVE
jgi:hypothetical protein